MKLTDAHFSIQRPLFDIRQRIRSYPPHRRHPRFPDGYLDVERRTLKAGGLTPTAESRETFPDSRDISL